MLYIRRVYSQESFCQTRFLGVQCQAQRHPDVVKYIADTVPLALSALMEGDSDEMSIIIMDQDTSYVHESYSLNFEKPLSKVTATGEDLEREMRDLILSVHSLEGVTVPKWNLETTFQIRLFLTRECQSSEALNSALTNGTWFCPDKEIARASERRRPIHQMAQSGCRLYCRKI